MLFSLLPGVRQLRAPLAAGFVWLVAGWFALAASIPPPETAVGPLSDVYRLAALAGETGVIAAAGFSAYLLGTLTVRATSGLTSFTWPPRPRRGGVTIRLAAPSPAGQTALREVVLARLSVRAENDSAMQDRLERTRIACEEPKPLTDDAVRRVFLDICYDIDHYVERVEADLDLMPLRLLGDVGEAETYAEFDRKRAEAEFRATVCVPLAALVVVLAARSTWWALLALAMPLAIVLDGRRHAVAAADILAESIRARASHLPVTGGSADAYAARPLSPAVERIMVAPLQKREGWLLRAATLGDSGEEGYRSAMVQLAQRNDRNGAVADAEHWYRKAGLQGEPGAIMWMARTLHRREQVEQADVWYRMAEDLGQEDADVVHRLREQLTVAELNAVKSSYAGDVAAMTAGARALLRADPTLWRTAQSWLIQAIDEEIDAAFDVYIPLLRERGETVPAQVMEDRRRALAGRA